jgi:hypothetical protein
MDQVERSLAQLSPAEIQAGIQAGIKAVKQDSNALLARAGRQPEAGPC